MPAGPRSIAELVVSLRDRNGIALIDSDGSMTCRELADQACMSEPNFYRTFKQTFGMTPVDYINQQRIALASRLLRTTNRYLADISLDCGFNNLTYFMKLFRREMGLSPAQYRKQALPA